MKSLTLIRVAYTLDGTFGVLISDEIPFVVTLEDPWLENTINISCIPEGSYRCIRVNSPKFGNTFEVTNVQNRTHILFHKGNTEEDTLGCILVGEKYGTLSNKPAILSSGEGYGEFMYKMRDVDEFMLEIVNGSY